MSNLLSHVAVIMDGNARWSKINKVSAVDAYFKGADSALEFIKNSINFGIKIVTMYAFSSDNWKRGVDFVSDIIFVLRSIASKSYVLEDLGVRLKFIGHLYEFPSDVVDIIAAVETKTEHCNKIHVNVALNYSARQEIVDVVQRVVSEKFPLKELNYDSLCEYMYTESDPDFLIRTGGEIRLSDFMLMRLAYTELYFCDVLWPDFSACHFENAMCEYESRNRRYGGQ